MGFLDNIVKSVNDGEDEIVKLQQEYSYMSNDELL